MKKIFKAIRGFFRDESTDYWDDDMKELLRQAFHPVTYTINKFDREDINYFNSNNYMDDFELPTFKIKRRSQTYSTAFDVSYEGIKLLRISIDHLMDDNNIRIERYYTDKDYFGFFIKELSDHNKLIKKKKNNHLDKEYKRNKSILKNFPY